MNTTDLIKAAENREYSKFEDMAKNVLRTKVGENSSMRNLWGKLNISKGIDKSMNEDNDSKNPETEKGLKAEYEAYFTKKLKKAGAESPAELDEEGKKKFFDDISKGWENGVGEK